MKGGCFGKILTFVFGVVVGFVLFAGTVAGAGYYLVTQVTINKVEDVAKTKFEFIDENAEIRDKSILDIVSMVTKGDIKNMTVAEVKSSFGIDLVSIIESSLDITIREDGKNELNDLPVLQVFQGDNLKIVLNSITFEDILKKAGIDYTSEDSLGSKPILKEHLNDPVIDGFNAILKSLNLNDMTIAEMEYLLGVSFGGSGILDNLANYKISALNDAINDITIENIMPDFDRDLYFDITGDNYLKSTTVAAIPMVSMEEMFDVLASDATREAGVDYYTLDETTNVLKLDNEKGTLSLKASATLPDFRERYAKDVDNNYTKDRNGYYYLNVPSGTFAADRFADAEGTTQDNFGRYRYAYTANGAGNYTLGYAAVKTDTGIVMQARKYMPTTAADDEGYVEYRLNAGAYERKNNEDGAEYAAAARYNVLPNVDTTKNELVEDADGQYVLVHIGKSQRIFKTLADESLSTMDGAMGDIKLSEVVEISEGDGIMYELRNSTLTSLPDDIKLIKIGKIMNVNERNIVTANATGAYVELPALVAPATYYGSFTTAYTSADSDTPLYLVKWRDDLSFTGNRYDLAVTASNAVVVGLADKTIQQLQDEGVDSLINNARLSGVINIEGDVYVRAAYATYAEAVVADATRDVYVYKLFDAADETEGFFSALNDEYGAYTVFYERIYTGAPGTNAVIKKMADIKVNNIATNMQAIIDETSLSEVLSVKEKYTIVADTAGEYIALNTEVLGTGESYHGTYNVGTTVDAPDTDVYFVKYKDETETPTNGGVFGGRYSITADGEISNGVLVKMADMKIGGLAGGMGDVVNSTLVSDVMEISGNVYRRYATFAAAEAAALTAPDNTVYLWDADKKLYLSTADTTLDEYYVAVYQGTSNTILRKIATMTTSSLASGGNINDAVNDCRLSEVMTITDNTSVLYQLRDTRIGGLEGAVTNLLNTATIGNLNDWGNLGLTEPQLSKTVGGVQVRNMSISAFLTYALSVLPST